MRRKNKNLIKQCCYRGGDNKSVRREKKQSKEKKWESLVWERLKVRKKILFPGPEEDNIFWKKKIYIHIYIYINKNKIK